MFKVTNLEERMKKMKKYSEKKLAEYDGKNVRPAYLAYNGKVYDVSSSFLWKDGAHQVLYNA